MDEENFQDESYCFDLISLIYRFYDSMIHVCQHIESNSNQNYNNDNKSNNENQSMEIDLEFNNLKTKSIIELNLTDFNSFLLENTDLLNEILSQLYQTVTYSFELHGILADTELDGNLLTILCYRMKSLNLIRCNIEDEILNDTTFCFLEHINNNHSFLIESLDLRYNNLLFEECRILYDCATEEFISDIEKYINFQNIRIINGINSISFTNVFNIINQTAIDSLLNEMIENSPWIQFCTISIGKLESLQEIDVSYTFHSEVEALILCLGLLFGLKHRKINNIVNLKSLKIKGLDNGFENISLNFRTEISLDFSNVLVDCSGVIR